MQRYGYKALFWILAIDIRRNKIFECKKNEKIILL